MTAKKLEYIDKARENPQNVLYTEMCSYLLSKGFKSRQKGSHRVFNHPKIKDKFINIQKDGKHCKKNQVKQIIAIIDELIGIEKGESN